MEHAHRTGFASPGHTGPVRFGACAPHHGCVRFQFPTQSKSVSILEFR